MNIFALDHSAFIMAVLCLCLSPLACAQLLECAAFVAGLGENSAITELADGAGERVLFLSIIGWAAIRSSLAAPLFRCEWGDASWRHDRRIKHALHAASQERYPHALAAHYVT